MTAESPLAPFNARYARNGMVCSIDHLASGAGVSVLRKGGSAADAAIAASAVLAVTSQHMCGVGGDLWALVHVPGEPKPFALNASG
ncbi:MAG: gamma-glutamyltransferase, partial [Acidimicrobiales bacterium]|nr:gamma-glutamyltransferase [Acidimicrobiales bacterium]